jgi:hypothetical protein
MENPLSSKATHRQQVTKPKRVARDDLANRELYRIIKHWPIENEHAKLNHSRGRVPYWSRRMDNANPAPVRRRAGHGKGRRDILTGQGDPKPARPV